MTEKPSDAGSLKALSERFRVFGEVECLGSSPLYQCLSVGIAEDDEVLLLASRCRPGQPPPNLLFGAVQFLLGQAATEPLARFYASLTADPVDPDNAYPTFRDFCLRRRPQIMDVITKRLVQTNEVSRCAYLLPTFCLIAEEAKRPLTLVEVGTSAGLNLLWDKYGYRYHHQGHLQTAGVTEAPVQIVTELLGDKVPALPKAMPSVCHRLGLDLNVVRLQNEEEARWLRALIWPEHAERFRLLDAASETLRAEPPELVSGDAILLLTEAIAKAPANGALVLYHTHVLNQFGPEARARLTEILVEVSKSRVVYRVGNDLGGGDGRQFLLKLLTYREGRCDERQLAYCDGHGRTVRWLA